MNLVQLKGSTKQRHSQSIVFGTIEQTPLLPCF